MFRDALARLAENAARIEVIFQPIKARIIIGKVAVKVFVGVAGLLRLGFVRFDLVSGRHLVFLSI